MLSNRVYTDGGRGFCWGLMLLASVNSNPANCYMHTGANMVNTQEGQLSAEFRNVL
jgi:hypothetical protein